MTAVTLQEAKAYLKVDFNDDDTLIQTLIEASEDWVSKETNHVLTPTTKQLEKGCYKIFDFPINSVTGDVVVKDCDLYSEVTVKNGTAVLNVGYTLSSDVPEALKVAVKKMVVYLYENRDMYEATKSQDVQLLISKYRRFIAYA